VIVVVRVEMALKDHLVGYLDLEHLAEKETLDFPVHLEVQDVMVRADLLSM